jgi:hypothetical protein
MHHPARQGATSGYVDCNHTNLITLWNTAYANYNALQLRLSIEQWHAVTAGLSYTWSKDLDNVSEIYNTLTGGNSNAFSQSPFDRSQAERGVSGLHYPQLTSVYMIFKIPASAISTLAGRLLGGWQVNPTWRFAGGQPYSVQEGLHSDYSSFSTPFDTTLCDPTQTTGSTPPCRQILANPWALLTPSELQPGDCGLADYYTHLNLRMIQHPLLAEFRSSRCIGS